RIFERRVATADDQDLFAPDVIFRLLTRDQNAATAKFIFALNAEFSPSDASGKHQILAPKFGTVYQDYDLFRKICSDDFCARTAQNLTGFDLPQKAVPQIAAIGGNSSEVISNGAVSL